MEGWGGTKDVGCSLGVEIVRYRFGRGISHDVDQKMENSLISGHEGL